MEMKYIQRFHNTTFLNWGKHTFAYIMSTYDSKAYDEKYYTDSNNISPGSVYTYIIKELGTVS